MRKITLTDKHQELLFQIPLFRDLPLNIKHSLLNRLDISLYSVDKKDIIATQGTLCKKLYVLLEGKLRVDIIDGLGNEVMIEYIVAARAFATPHLFSSDGVLPATFTAMEDSTLLTASKESMFKLISEEPKILHNFLCITGNCNVCTVSRLKTPITENSARTFRCLLAGTQEKEFSNSQHHPQSGNPCRISECNPPCTIERD